MNKYLDKGHLEKISKGEIQKSINEVYYLPYHLISKGSSTTSLKVVFDRSAKTSNNVSLKEKLIVGKRVQ